MVRPAPRAPRGPQRGRRARLGPWSHARRRGGPSPVTVLPGPPTPRSAARPVGQGPAGAPVRLPRGKRAAWRSGSASLPWSPLGRGVPRPPAVAGGGGPRGPLQSPAPGTDFRLGEGLEQTGSPGTPTGRLAVGGAALLSLALQCGPRPPREHSLAAGGRAREAPRLRQGTWLSAVVPGAQHGAAGLPWSGDTRGQLVPWVASSARERLVGALHLRTACPGRPRPAAPQWVPSGGPVPLRFRGESF